MKIINLLPKDEQRQLRLELMAGQVMRFWVWVLASSAGLFALALAGAFYLNQQINSHNIAVANLSQTLKSAATQQLEKEVSLLNRQIALIDSLRRDHYYWSKALVELSYLLDSNTRLNSVTMNRETGEVKVTGTAGDRDGILAFWAAVHQSDVFHKIDFPLSNLESDQDAPFTFTFYLKPEELKRP